MTVEQRVGLLVEGMSKVTAASAPSLPWLRIFAGFCSGGDMQTEVPSGTAMNLGDGPVERVTRCGWACIKGTAHKHWTGFSVAVDGRQGRCLCQRATSEAVDDPLILYRAVSR